MVILSQCQEIWQPWKKECNSVFMEFFSVLGSGLGQQYFWPPLVLLFLPRLMLLALSEEATQKRKFYFKVSFPPEFHLWGENYFLSHGLALNYMSLTHLSWFRKGQYKNLFTLYYYKGKFRLWQALVNHWKWHEATQFKLMVISSFIAYVFPQRYHFWFSVSGPHCRQEALFPWPFIIVLYGSVNP